MSPLDAILGLMLALVLYSWRCAAKDRDFYHQMWNADRQSVIDAMRNLGELAARLPDGDA